MTEAVAPSDRPFWSEITLERTAASHGNCIRCWQACWYFQHAHDKICLFSSAGACCFKNVHTGPIASAFTDEVIDNARTNSRSGERLFTPRRSDVSGSRGLSRRQPWQRLRLTTRYRLFHYFISSHSLANDVIGSRPTRIEPDAPPVVTTDDSARTIISDMTAAEPSVTSQPTDIPHGQSQADLLSSATPTPSQSASQTGTPRRSGRQTDRSGSTSGFAQEMPIIDAPRDGDIRLPKFEVQTPSRNMTPRRTYRTDRTGSDAPESAADFLRDQERLLKDLPPIPKLGDLGLDGFTEEELRDLEKWDLDNIQIHDGCCSCCCVRIEPKKEPEPPKPPLSPRTRRRRIALLITFLCLFVGAAVVLPVLFFVICMRCRLLLHPPLSHIR